MEYIKGKNRNDPNVSCSCNISNTNTSTLMGGWLLSIPETSQNKELAWELITIMLEPEVLIPMLLQQGYLPTQKSIGEGVYSGEVEIDYSLL